MLKGAVGLATGDNEALGDAMDQAIDDALEEPISNLGVQ